ncbi:hypothetical protein [Lewinella sp. IMCC34191]|uniref:hypothetical protein n=1 Tax=Lewinella sp. IMCC34191 TaxID=2259172 RepID=UPI0013003361|nr:hypothetical protein [Lewinella sp. IMCC34191]
MTKINLALNQLERGQLKCPRLREFLSTDRAISQALLHLLTGRVVRESGHLVNQD